MTETRTTLSTLAVALLVALTALTVAPLAGATQASTPTITVDAPNSVTAGSTTSAALAFSNVSDTDGVGSYTVNITYDPSVVEISASGTSSFDVAVSNPEPGLLRITGYTSEYPGPTGSGVLANLQITGENAADATIDVEVETFSDADGNDLPRQTQPESITVEQSTDDGTTGGGDVDSDPQDDDSSSGSSDSTTAPSGGSASSGAGTGTNGTAEFVYSAASLSQTEVAAGSSVTLSLTVKNRGNASGEAEVALYVDGEFVESRFVTVAANGTAVVEITRAFETPGEYVLRLNDKTAGTLSVTSTPEPTPSPTVTTTATSSPTTTPTASPTTVTDSPTATGTPTEGSGPGFGLIGALLAALSVGAMHRRRA